MITYDILYCTILSQTVITKEFQDFTFDIADYEKE